MLKAHNSFNFNSFLTSDILNENSFPKLNLLRTYCMDSTMKNINNDQIQILIKRIFHIQLNEPKMDSIVDEMYNIEDLNQSLIPKLFQLSNYDFFDTKSNKQNVNFKYKMTDWIHQNIFNKEMHFVNNIYVRELIFQLISHVWVYLWTKALNIKRNSIYGNNNERNHLTIKEELYSSTKIYSCINSTTTATSSSFINLISSYNNVIIPKSKIKRKIFDPILTLNHNSFEKISQKRSKIAIKSDRIIDKINSEQTVNNFESASIDTSESFINSDDHILIKNEIEAVNNVSIISNLNSSEDLNEITEINQENSINISMCLHHHPLTTVIKPHFTFMTYAKKRRIQIRNDIIFEGFTESDKTELFYDEWRNMNEHEKLDFFKIE